jgi:HlyD family secretion protein
MRNEIVARGRIEPLGRVTIVSGPVDGTVTVVRKLMVDQGSKLEAGQVIAVLDQFDAHKADLAVAERNVELAELQLVQVKAGAKQADRAAQTDVIAAKQANLVRVQQQWNRLSALFSAGHASKELLEQAKADLDQAKSDLGQAGNALKSLTETRSVDQAVATAQVEVAKATAIRTAAEMKRAEILSPGPGTVLSIEARAGEAIQADGVLRMADLSHLIVVAEVDQANIGVIREGMAARIEGSVLPEPIKAKVTRIGHEVFRQKRPASDVLIGRDARIVEVELTPETALPSVVGAEVMVRLTTAQLEQH